MDGVVRVVCARKRVVLVNLSLEIFIIITKLSAGLERVQIFNTVYSSADTTLLASGYGTFWLPGCSLSMNTELLAICTALII